MEPEVDSRLVSHFNGKWQASNGPFEHFDGLGETGWSLLAQAVNHWHMHEIIQTPVRQHAERAHQLRRRHVPVVHRLRQQRPAGFTQAVKVLKRTIAGLPIHGVSTEPELAGIS